MHARRLTVVCLAILVIGVCLADPATFSKEKQAVAVNPLIWDIFIPPMIKGVACKTLKFSNLAGCCLGSGVPNYVSSTAISNCVTTATSKAYSLIFTTYYLNTFMNLKNQLLLNNPLVVATFGPQACFTECVFGQQGWLYPNDSINYNVLAANVTSVSPSAWGPVLTDIIKNCSTYVETNIGSINVGSKFCSAKPAVLAQCIRKAVYVSCPGPSMSNTTSCVALRRNVQYCDVFRMGSFWKYYG